MSVVVKTRTVLLLHLDKMQILPHCQVRTHVDLANTRCSLTQARLAVPVYTDNVEKWRL